MFVFQKTKLRIKHTSLLLFHREKPHLRGGYYLRIRPGESFIAAGFWGPEKDDLFRIRKELEADVEEYRKHTENPEFKAIWGDNKGECVKNSP